MARTNRIVNRLPQFIAQRQALAARSMTQALILGASEASTLTPIDTSTLINSQYRAVEKVGSKVVGRVGYTADYALAVHDPDNKQTFRRASARKEFLKLGFERAEPNIRAVVKSGLKTR
jgi:phage tail sheath protein FI